VTIALAVHLDTTVPKYIIFFLSAIALSLSIISICFSIGNDSPVRDDSITSKFCISIRRASAGILSHGAKRMISPGTNSS
jgi:hypothetical protein